MRLLVGGLMMVGSALAEEVRVTSWNLESGGESNVTVLAEQICQMPRSDVWTFLEVKDHRWADELVWGMSLHGGSYDYQLGREGKEERMMIAYDRDRLDLLNKDEMRNLNDGGHRSPIAAEMVVKASGQRFILLLNHLARQKTSLRHKQAKGLNEWAAKQETPIVGTGTYNFDWKVSDGDRKHDEAYDMLTVGDVFSWVRPDALVRTQNNRANDVQDFVFVSGLPETWSVTSEIMLRQGDFPDNDETSDHRPVVAILKIE